jgi:hypothetical protein
MINADTTMVTHIKFWDEGRYTDFTVDWYKDVGGVIISTMIFNIAWPIIEFVMFFSLRTAYRLWDNSFTFKSSNTKTKILIDYVNLYSGPEYVIHYKYSFILNVVFMTFMFGAGMPILFPIALCSLIVLYIMERLQAAYSYQKPPMFDASLNDAAINLLIAAPIGYAAVGFWMFNNPTMFHNDKVVFTQIYGQHAMNDHNFYTFADYFVDQSFPLFVFTILTLTMYVTRKIWFKWVTEKYSIGIESIGKTEETSFYEALSHRQRKQLVR